MSQAIIDQILAKARDEKSHKLSVKFGATELKLAEHIPRQNAQKAPELTLTIPEAATPSPTYLAICLDLDAPFPSFHPLAPINHWIQSGLTRDPATGSLTSTLPVAVDWAPPHPPPFSGPHRYVFALYEQPADFDPKKFGSSDGKPVPVSARVRFDMQKFVNESKVTDIVAATWFVSK